LAPVPTSVFEPSSLLAAPGRDHASLGLTPARHPVLAAVVRARQSGAGVVADRDAFLRPRCPGWPTTRWQGTVLLPGSSTVDTDNRRMARTASAEPDRLPDLAHPMLGSRRIHRLAGHGRHQWQLGGPDRSHCWAADRNSASIGSINSEWKAWLTASDRVRRPC